MTTLIIRDNSLNAQRFLEFVRTLPFVDIVEQNDSPIKKVKPVVARALKKSEHGKELIICKDADDMFKKLGI